MNFPETGGAERIPQLLETTKGRFNDRIMNSVAGISGNVEVYGIEPDDAQKIGYLINIIDEIERFGSKVEELIQEFNDPNSPIKPDESITPESLNNLVGMTQEIRKLIPLDENGTPTRLLEDHEYEILAGLADQLVGASEQMSPIS